MPEVTRRVKSWQDALTFSIIQRILRKSYSNNRHGSISDKNIYSMILWKQKTMGRREPGLGVNLRNSSAFARSV